MQCEVDGQAFVAAYLDIVYFRQSIPRELHPLLLREHRFLAGIRGDRDDDFVEQATGSANKIFVTKRNRVERSRIHRGDCHLLLLVFPSFTFKSA